MTDELLSAWELRCWVGALVHYGKPYLRADLVDRLHWNGKTHDKHYFVRVLPEGPTISASNLTHEALLKWWTDDVCAPHGITANRIEIARRAMHFYELLEEADQHIQRLEKLRELMGLAVPPWMVVGVCERCKDLHRHDTDQKTPLRNLRDLEGLLADELQRVRAAMTDAIETRRTRKKNGPRHG